MIDRSTAQDELLGKAANEFFAAVSRGENPSIADFASRYSAIADLIERTFPALALIDGSHSNLDPADVFASHKRPKSLGDFQILHEIGRGGMGVVYEAEQLSMGRKVALKILPLAAMLDEKRLERFKNEVRAVATLDHPNCVPVFAVGEERGVHFYAMKLIRGQSVADVIEDLQHRDTRAVGTGSLPRPESIATTETVPIVDHGVDTLSLSRTSRKRDYFRRVAKLGSQVADALHHAHERGVVHRDIKPGNLLIDGSGTVWVTDFGLARIDADAGITMTGDLLGTLRYMSPEQALGKRALVDHRVDVYSLGATLYELLTLQPAIKGDDRIQMLKYFAESEPTAPRKIDPSIPVELETILGKAMETSPTDRYETAAEMAKDLQRYLAHEPILAKRSTLTGRVAKWVRRYPVWTALIAVILLSASTLLIGAFLHTNRLAGELAVNKNLRLAAESQQAEMRRAKYLVDMRLANRSLQDGQPIAAGKRLENYLPPSPGAVERDFPWYYLWEEYQSSLRYFLGHTGAVTSVVIAERESLLISASHDKTVRFFNLDKKNEIAQISDINGNVNTVALTPDEQVLFIAADSGVLVAWDISSVASGGQPEEMATLEGHTDDVFSLAVSPDGKHLASAGADANVLIWELPSMKMVSSLDGHTGWIRCLDFSPDGKTLASISHDANLILWDVHEAKEKRQIKIASGRQLGLSLSFHPNGQVIAAGNSHGDVRLIRVSDGETISISSGHGSWFRSLDFSDNGRLLAAAGNDPFIRLLKVDNKMQITPWRTLPGHQRQTWSVCFTADQGTLVSCGLDSTIAIRNIGVSELGTNEALPSGFKYAELIRRRLTTTRSRDRLYLSGNQNIRLFEADNVTIPVESMIVSDSGASGGTISADGRWTGSLQLQGISYKKTERTHNPSLLTLDGVKHKDTTFYALAFHPSKDVLAAGMHSGHLLFMKVPSEEKIAELHPFGETRITDILFTSGGEFVAANFCNLFDSDRATTVIWDADTLSEVGRVEGVERLLAVSPFENQLALVNRNQSLQLWNIDTQSTGVTFAGHTEKVISGDFSPDGKYLATSASSGPIKIWSIDTGQLVLDIFHDLKVPQIVFGPEYSAYATDLEILSREPEPDYRHHLVPLLERHLQNDSQQEER